MHKISETTFFCKRLFPCCWFGFLAIVLLGSIVQAVMEPQPTVEIVLVVSTAIFMAVAGYGIFSLMVFDLVDDVLDDGDELVVKNRGTEERIPVERY